MRFGSNRIPAATHRFSGIVHSGIEQYGIGADDWHRCFLALGSGTKTKPFIIL
jgi:hypothetical protein